LCDAFVAVAEETGIRRRDDFNGASQEGVSYFQTTSAWPPLQRGVRVSPPSRRIGGATSSC